MVEDSKSEFPPKIYHSHDPKASVVRHFHLWRDFEDNSVTDKVQQQQQQKSQLNSDSDLCANSSHEDETSSFICVSKSSNKTTKTPRLGSQNQENNASSVNDINLSNFGSNSKGDETTTIVNERLDKALFDYSLNGMKSEAAVRSANRTPITKEELWMNSKLFAQSMWQSGCTVTIADFNKTRYRLERRTFFAPWAYDKYTKLHDCDPKVNTKDEFYNKLEVSRSDLANALRNTPDWSMMRWINVNGLERSAFFAIVDECKLNLKAVSRMLNKDDDIDAEMYDDQLFCQLPILYEPKQPIREITNIVEKKKDMTSFLDSDPSYTGVEIKMEREHGWLFLRDSKTVITFFQKSGEDIEELVFFDFLRDLLLHEEMNIDASMCFENILSGFARLLSAPSLMRNLEYKLGGSTSKKLHDLHFVTPNLVYIKARIDTLINVIDRLKELPPISDDCKLHLVSFNKILKQQSVVCEERILWNKTQTEWHTLLSAESNNKYMFTLAIVSAVYAPFSFVCSIFGMKFFDNSYVKYDRLYIYFIIAIPLTITTVVLIFLKDIKKLFTELQIRSHSRWNSRWMIVETILHYLSSDSSSSPGRITILTVMCSVPIFRAFSSLRSASRSVKTGIITKFSDHDHMKTNSVPNMNSFRNIFKTTFRNRFKKFILGGQFGKQSNSNLNGNSTGNLDARVSVLSTQPDSEIHISNSSSRTSAVNQNSAETNINTNVNNPSDNNVSIPADFNNITPFTVQLSITANDVVSATEATENINQSIDANHFGISTESLGDATSNRIPGQSKDNLVKDAYVLKMSPTRKSNVVETPKLTVPIEDNVLNEPLPSSGGDSAGINVVTSNFIPGQSKHNPVQDTSVQGKSQSKKSNAAETLSSIHGEDRSSNESAIK
ncbi:unnamed protein product [Ambrosiozyma monospora]|uniref:Unnamed protein product n=1 Tax=Ambrosiozyma monospora TaxID=43982 RepID=A0ACB5SUY3_AMBMO|nr:unnamed protein product [Ambrosiozyma monospora]